MDIKEVLFSLCDNAAIGNVDFASKYAKSVLSNYCEVKELGGLSFCGAFNANSEKTVLIEAHIDEVGMIVTHIDDNGFLTVANCGGIDVKTLPSLPVVIHGKKEVKGVFCSTPMHLSKKEECFNDISEVKIDTALKEKAKDYINVGDFVTYDVKSASLLGSRVTAKSLDDRAGCAVLLSLAERLSKEELPVNVILLFSDAEELGLRGARTAVFDMDVNEAIAVDVSFAYAPDLPAHKCGTISKGAMIGISPVLSSAVYKKLLKIASEEGFAYQTEVMGGTTGTDADVISVTKGGIPCGLVSIPIRNMHSSSEVADINDIISCTELIYKYIIGGGAV